jgi:hypothetical protein
VSAMRRTALEFAPRWRPRVWGTDFDLDQICRLAACPGNCERYARSNRHIDAERCRSVRMAAHS